jgi:pilus assembly protein Flp/PilA
MEAGRILHALLQDESGVTAIEYALLGSLIAVAIMTAVASVGVSLGALYEMVSDEVVAATSGA